MEVKLIRSVLVGDADVMPTRGGTVVDLDDVKAKEFIAAGLAEEVKAKKSKDESEDKKAPEVENKKAPEPSNKAKK